MMDGGVGYSLPISKTMTPFPEQKVSGSREMAVTSAWRLAHPEAEGGVAGHRGFRP